MSSKAIIRGLRGDGGVLVRLLYYGCPDSVCIGPGAKDMDLCCDVTCVGSDWH